MSVGNMADFNNGILKSLYEKSLSGTGSDLVFKVGPDHEIVHAHTFIVTEASPAFKSMLNGCWDLQRDEGGKIAQELPVDDPNHFKTFIKLMYGFIGYSADDFEQLFPVYRMADKYQATEVQKALSDFAASLARSKLTVDNVVDIYLSAKEHGIEGLLGAAREYIFLNIIKVWESNTWLELDEEAVAYVLAQDTLSALDVDSIKLRCVSHCCQPRCNNSNCAKTNYGSQNERLILGKVLQWIKHQKEKTSGDSGFVSRVLSHIRICQMTHRDFMEAMKEARAELMEEDMGKFLIARLASTHDGVSPFNTLGPGFRKLGSGLTSRLGTCTHAVSQTFREVYGFYVCQNRHVVSNQQNCPTCGLEIQRLTTLD